MVLKNRLIILIFLLIISKPNSGLLAMDDIIKLKVDKKNKIPDQEKNKIPDQEKDQEKDKEKEEEDKIGSWTAAKVLLRSTGRNIIGPVVEVTLSLIGDGIKNIANTLEGDKNKHRRENIYTVASGALLGWTAYKWSKGESIIPYWMRNFWTNKVIANAKKIIIKNNDDIF